MLFAFIFIANLNAANWLMLQGIESKKGHSPWGFFQVRGQYNEGDIIIKNGINKTPFSYIKPTLEHQSEIQIARARVGLRGSITDDNNINYFLLSEFAQNGVNNPLGYQTHNYLIDASITFKYLPVYIRAGRFKYAGSEEGHMARFTSPFINFSTVSDQLMLERFIDTSSSDVVVSDSYLGEPEQGVGAYRDLGVQFFHSFDISKDSSLTLSYMLGNGSGLAYSNLNADNYTHYGYLSYENILGEGKGYRQEAYKLYAWYQDGKRKLSANGSSELYDRVRYGVGGTYFYKNLRVEAEYMKGTGMIFTGAKDTDNNPSKENLKYEIQASNENESDGYYLLSTYRVFKPLEIIARYDRYDRMTNSNSLYREFESFTTGFSYIFKAYDRIDVNYAFNNIRAPENTTADKLLSDSVGNMISIQYTMVFK